LSNVVLAVLKLMLFRITSQDDICVSMAVANRSHPDTENLLGCFVNVLPIRTRLAADMEFDQLVDQVAATVYEALERQSYPFDMLVSRLNRVSGSVIRPFLDVIYAFQSDGRVDIDISVERSRGNLRPAESIDFAFGFAKAELCLNAADHGEEGLGLTLEYDSALFGPSTISRYFNTLTRFARAVAGRPALENSSWETPGQ
jgi:non-ribosomal peptide synthetase component F